jgi:hypothetical protein
MERLKILVAAIVVLTRLGEARAADARWSNWLRYASNAAGVGQSGRGDGAGIAQNGAANAARVGQRRVGQSAMIHQLGDGNFGIVGSWGAITARPSAQTGNGNAACLVQAGRNLHGGVAQNWGQSASGRAADPVRGASDVERALHHHRRWPDAERPR